MTTLLRPGDRCAGYEIVRHIGTGRTAEVYLAVAPSGERCAFKLMAAPSADKQRARFAQEGEALARIVHPNVVRVYAAGAWGSHVWLALELVEGETLDQKSRAGVRLLLEDLIDILQQVCDGLAEAHRLGVVHRDITPDNILVTREGRVKLIDFGMAKLRAWGLETTTDRQIGSAMYMAPEQMEGAPASAAMDIYSLGHVFYFALASGVHAMGDEERSLAAIVAWHFQEPPRPLLDVASWVPAELAVLVHQMIEKDPARRPANVYTVLLQLRRVGASHRAPQLHAVRSVPRLNGAPAMARTIPMAAQDATAPATPVVHDASRAASASAAPMPAMSSAIQATPTPALSAAACSAPMPAMSTAAQGAHAPAMSPAAPGASPPVPAPVTTVPAEPAQDRLAVVPAPWPTLKSATAPDPAPPLARQPAADALGPAAPAELRTTDVPVESAARRSRVSPRRVPAAALWGAGLGGAVLATAGWMVLAHVRDPAPETTRAPQAAAPALPPMPGPAPAPSSAAVPTSATPTATAATAPTTMAPAAPTTTTTAATPPKPAATPPKPAGTAPARTPPRHPPATTPHVETPAPVPPPAKNRLFGMDP